jgi:hypothetical protein
MHKQTQITNNTSNGAISISIFRKIETVNPEKKYVLCMIYFCNAEHLTDIIYFHILHHTTRIFLFHIHAHEGSFYFLAIPPKVKYQDMMFVGLTVSIFLNIEIEIAPLEVLFVICVCLCIVVSNSYCVVFCLSSSCDFVLHSNFNLILVREQVDVFRQYMGCAN